MLGAEVVEHVAAADAEGGLQGIGRVIETCVDDLFSSTEGTSQYITIDIGQIEIRAQWLRTHLGVAAARLGSRRIVSLQEDGGGAFMTC